MSHKLLRAAQSAVRVDKPSFVVLSQGAGVQSTTITLLAAEGVIPKPDVAIFADTGWEPKKVYRHLERLRPVLEAAGIDLRVVKYGDIREESTSRSHCVSLPLFIADAGILRRQCTPNYKLVPIHREIRKLLGGRTAVGPCARCNGTGKRVAPPTLKAGRPEWGECSVCRGTGEITRIGTPTHGRWVEQWIGFSTDEITRVSDQNPPYVRNAYPLLDLGMSRDDCTEWLTERGWGDTPKSACIGCPFHGNDQWRELRDNDPEGWADAIEVDEAIRSLPGSTMEGGEGAAGFLHLSRVPLAEADLDDHRFDKGDAIGCSPHGCRSDQPHALQEVVVEGELL